MLKDYLFKPCVISLSILQFIECFECFLSIFCVRMLDFKYLRTWYVIVHEEISYTLKTRRAIRRTVLRYVRASETASTTRR